MALNTELLNLLVCPQTKQSVALADATILERINNLIAADQLANQSGQKLNHPLSAVLVRADRQVFYPIRDDIPIMLFDQAILNSGLL